MRVCLEFDRWRDDEAVIAVNIAVALPFLITGVYYAKTSSPPKHEDQVLDKKTFASKKTTIGILGILFGWLGDHRFMLGDTKGGILRILITVVTCGLGSFIGLIEGTIYLTKSEDEYYQLYGVEKKGWF